jgi:Fic family protein
MPSKRRGIVRALLNPNRVDPLTAGDVETILNVSRPTARDRIDEVVALGIGEVVEVTGRGGTTKAVEVNAEFRWPNGIAFPVF